MRRTSAAGLVRAGVRAAAALADDARLDRAVSDPAGRRQPERRARGPVVVCEPAAAGGQPGTDRVTRPVAGRMPDVVTGVAAVVAGVVAIALVDDDPVGVG